LKYNAVIFDFDGTLADTASDVWKSVEYAAKELGGHMDPEFTKVKSNLGAPMKEIFHAILPILPDSLFNQFKEEIKYHYRIVNEYPETVLYPGMEKLLCRLKIEKIPCYIVSAKPLKSLERILYMKNWHTLFTAWYSQEMKDNEVISKAILVKQILENELHGCRTVYVGDTYTDVIAARECKIDCIAAAYGDGDDHKLLSEQPTHIIYHASELEEYF
jgi:phosphoglycolate phosphatase